jgi:hypothetical protein
MSSGGLSSRCYHSRSRRTRWGVLGPGFWPGLLRGILIRLVTGASWCWNSAVLAACSGASPCHVSETPWPPT